MSDARDPWDAEHGVDLPLARRLVAAQWPDVDAAALRPLGSGWDNDVYAAGELVVRFPRRTLAVPLIETEARVLPALAPRLPVAIPAASRRGAPSAAFPHPFLAHRRVPGVTAETCALTPAERAALCPALGALLAALHAIDADQGQSLGAPVHRPPDRLARLAELARAALPRLADHAPDVHLQAAGRALREIPPEDEPGVASVLVHGDLDARHLCLLPGPRLVGVIDWGDVAVGDPAVDLALAYAFLPAPARPRLFAAYSRAVTEATHARARFLALARYGVLLHASLVDRAGPSAHGRSPSDAPLAEARWALAAALDAV